MSILKNCLQSSLALSLFAASAASGQTAAFTPGSREIFAIDFASVPVGALPQNVKVLWGKASIVDKDGTHMVRATEPTELLFNLRESLPDAFTIEFEIIPKKCCNPNDLMFEGTPAIGRSPTSMQIEWHPMRLRAYGGGGVDTQLPMPGEIAEVVASQPTKVQASFEGGSFKLFTNDRMVMDLSNRKFAHGRVLRVSLGGQDANEYAVYLSKLRIAGAGPTLAGPPGQAKSGTGTPVQAPTQPPSSQPPSSQPPSSPPTTSQTTTPTITAPGAASPATQVPVATASKPTSASAAVTQPSGPMLPSAIGGITVTQASSGPVVGWAAPSVQSTYSVKRWKTDDPTCCNNASSSGLTTTSWQDAALPRVGTYVYEVTATFAGGSAKGQSQFSYVKLAGGQIAGIVPADTPKVAQQQSAATAGPSGPVPGPTNLSAWPLSANGSTNSQGWGIVLTWAPVPSATGYRVYRMIAGSSNPGQVVNVVSIQDPSGASFSIDPSTTPSTTYTYWVEARFADGSASGPSATATVTESGAGAIPRIQNLKVSLGAATTIAVPSGTGVTIKVPANELTWSWDPIQVAFQYVVSYAQPDWPTPTPVREIVPRANPQDFMNPAQPVPTFTRTIAQGQTVSLCVTLADVPDPAPRVTDPAPWTCLATKVPLTAVASSTTTSTSEITAPISSTQRTVTALSVGPAPVLQIQPGATQPTIYGSPTTAYVAWYPVAGAVRYRVNRAPAGITTFTMLTPDQFTDLRFNDVVPDRSKTYTYEVTAFQADGKFGTSKATFTPPAATDPTQFTAIAQTDGSVLLNWTGVPFANTKYLLTGPGATSGVLVSENQYTVKGLTPGTYAWTVAANYDGAGVITPSAAWPKATATITNHTGRYAIVVDALRAEHQTIDVDADGKSDEVYVSAFVMTFDRTTNRLVQQSSLRSTAMGDITVVGPPARTLAGSASTSGGIQTNDLISKIFAETYAGATAFSQFVLWQGTLNDGVEAITIRPMIWESDNNTQPYGAYRSLLESSASQLGFGGPDVEARMKSLSLLPVQLTGKTGFATYKNDADRPIGLYQGDPYVPATRSLLDPVYARPLWSDQVIAVTREAIETALNSTSSTSPVGVIPISFRDINSQPEQHQYDMSGLYTLYLKVIRLP